MRASHRRRSIVGTALGAVVGVWLAHGFVSDARRQVALAAQDRGMVVALEAAASLLANAEGAEARRLLAAWQSGTKEIAEARLVRGMQLEASTAPEDRGERAAPRRLAHDEKPLYDRAQRIGSAVQSNRDEGSAKPEIELEQAGGQLYAAAPVAGAPPGMLEVRAVAPPVSVPTGWVPFLLAALVAIVAAALAALPLGERRILLAIAASVALVAPLAVLVERETSLVARERRDAAGSVARRVSEQGALLRSIAPDVAVAPASWDADAFRRPRGEVLADGSVDPQKAEASASAVAGELRRALLSALALSLALSLLTGLGAFNRIGASLKKNRQAYLYIAPAILGMAVLVFYPFSYGVTLSFTDANLYNASRPLSELWIGVRNYRDILGDFSVARRAEDGGFVISYLNFYWTLLFTVIWTVTNVTLGVTSGLILALILNTRGLAFKPVYRVILILPWAMPNYITALIWKGMFHQQFGVINHMLRMVGLPAVNWFDRPFTSFLTALATNGWLSFPFMMVVSLGALQSIPNDLYEAARVDGASRWQQFKAITLPSLRPALVPAVILSVVWTFNMFNIIYLVTAGEPGGATEILVTQSYKFAFEQYRYGYAAAYSVIIFIILLVYGVFQNRVTRATEA